MGQFLKRVGWRVLAMLVRGYCADIREALLTDSMEAI